MAENNLLLRGKGRPFEALIEFAIKSSGWVVIASIVLIFIFVGKEAIPLLTSSEVHEEVTIGSMVLPREGETLEERHPWQPVSNVPSACPSCQSSSVVTTAKSPDAESYWRCCSCGEVWNASRRRSPRTGVRSWT